MKCALFVLVSLLFPSALALYDGELGEYFVLIDEQTGTGYTLDEFLDMTANHDDWKRGGWDANSRMTRVAKEIFWQINGAEPSELEDPMVLVPYLEEGVENILSHYNPRDGLVGESGSDIVHRLGGTLKGTNIYWVIVLIITAATFAEGIRCKKFSGQLTVGLVLIPLILRLLWLK